MGNPHHMPARRLSPAAEEALSMLLRARGLDGASRRLRSAPTTIVKAADGGLVQHATAARLEERLAGLEELDVGGAA